MNWLRKAKAAFQRLKARSVKHQEVKQWGINIVNRLFEIIGVDVRVGCPPRQVSVVTEYENDLRVELRVPYCEEEDLKKMRIAVDVLAKEAMELTPRDTGLLQSSQYTIVDMEEKEVVLGVVGYDISQVFRNTDSGNTVYYALYVHNIDNHHGQDKYPNNPPRAQYRFLADAWLNRYIQDKIRGMFE